MSYPEPHDQTPQSLFAERPMYSDFARRAPSYAWRRRITLLVLIVAIGGGLDWGYHDYRRGHPAEIPLIKAEGSYRQRPQEPGGLEIAHQDVQVYQELERNAPGPTPVEHLLPPPEMPQVSAQAMPQAQPARIETLKPMGRMPAPTTVSSRAVTAPVVESLEPAKPAQDFDDVLGEKTPRVPVPTTVMPQTAAVTTSMPAPAPSPIAAVAATAQPVPLTAAQPRHVPDVVPVPAPVVKSAAHPAPPRSLEQVLRDVSASAKITGTKNMNVASVSSADSVEATSNVATGGGHNSGVQLASVPDYSGAQQTMQELQKKYSTTLQGVALHVVKADLGPKGVHYRVESSALTDDRARNLCAALKNLNAGCILVRH